MKTITLTKKQEKAVLAIATMYEKKHVMPTYAKVAAKLKLKIRSVYQYIQLFKKIYKVK